LKELDYTSAAHTALGSTERRWTLDRPITREEMLAAKGTDKQAEVVARIDSYVDAIVGLASCACKVDGCDPTGVRECEKGIRERRSLP